MNGNTTQNGTLIPDFRHIVRASRDVNTLGSRYTVKGNELIMRLNVVESQVASLTEATGTLLRRAYRDLVTSSSCCGLSSLDTSSLDSKKNDRLKLELSFNNELQTLCIEFRLFGLAHVLLEVCIYLYMYIYYTTLIF